MKLAVTRPSRATGSERWTSVRSVSGRSAYTGQASKDGPKSNNTAEERRLDVSLLFGGPLCAKLLDNITTQLQQITPCEQILVHKRGRKTR